MLINNLFCCAPNLSTSCLRKLFESDYKRQTLKIMQATTKEENLTHASTI